MDEMSDDLLGAWKCYGCHITFKGAPAHRTAATDDGPVYRYCDHCWSARQSPWVWSEVAP